MTSEAHYLSRQAKLGKALIEAGLDALALNPGPGMIYLTGLHFHLMERPTLAIFVPGEPVMLVMPEFETAKTVGLTYPLQAFSYGDNPAAWHEAFEQASQKLGLDGMKIGVEPARLRVMELRYLETAAPKAQFLPGEKGLASLRVQKDESEIAAMRKAVDIAQRAVIATLSFVQIGMTEHDLATELILQMLRAGADPEIPFSPNVSFGANTANPHANPSQRDLRPGDLLLIDWGCSYQGYISDLTRTFAIGKVEAEFARIAQIVAEANAVGRAACRPGVEAGEVDRSGRQVIEKAGYGPYFTHRLGHGIGMEVHEDPYIFVENPLILRKGMTFTVEPGIYLPGRGGVRIEDNMVITEAGAESLSDLPRNLTRVA